MGKTLDTDIGVKNAKVRFQERARKDAHENENAGKRKLE
jgi:hypothetical protein